jgi:BCD family chlorophyll transporter-like MFS transporter
MAFSMQDVLLEPYGGQVLGLTVGETTALTATLAFGGLMGFSIASRVLSRGADPFRMASIGAMVGIPAFVTVIFAAPFNSPELFSVGVFLLGFGGGLFGHGTLTATMNLAPKEQVGLALGAWGAVQATAAGVAMAMGGIFRDIGTALARQHTFGAGLAGPATGYTFVYSIEVVLLFATLVAMGPLVRQPNKIKQESSNELGLAELRG